MRHKIILLAACSLAAACGEPPDDESSDRSGLDKAASTATSDDDVADMADGEPDSAQPDTGGDTAAPDAAAQDGEGLGAIFDTVFVASGCTSGYCHGAFGIGSAEDMYAAFVNVEAAQPTCGRTHYVVPGDPEASILWVKIRETTDEDIECEVTKMPKDRQEPLPAEITDLVYEWILAGAEL